MARKMKMFSSLASRTLFVAAWLCGASPNASATGAICDPPGPAPRFGCSWSTETCDWICAICDPFGAPPRTGCSWDTNLCNWICPGYTGTSVSVTTSRPPAVSATVYVRLSSLCDQTGTIEACQGQLTVGPGMTLSSKCQALASTVAGSCAAQGYTVAENDCDASATFVTSNTGCPRAQFALGITNDPAVFDQSGQSALPDGESEIVTGSCQPVAAPVTTVRIDKAGGADLLVSWDASANAESYAVYDDAAPAGAFATQAASTAATSVSIPSPPGSAYFLIGASNWVCGSGTKN